MKFSTREDIAAPIDHVFRAVSDFRVFERAALRRGVAVDRMETLTHPDAEMGWTINFTYRKKPRQISAELVRYDPPNGLMFESYAPGITAIGLIELVALSRQRTRLSMSVDMRPTSIGGRLTIQSLKLTKTKLNQKFKNRVAKLADQIESSAT